MLRVNSIISYCHAYYTLLMKICMHTELEDQHIATYTTYK